MSLPPLEQTRKHVIEAIILEDSTTFENIADIVFEKTSQHYTYADVKEIITDMIISGRISSENNYLKIVEHFEDTPETPDYAVSTKNLDTLKPKSISGNKKIVSVGSEDFSYNFDKLKEGQKIVVSLIPEMENKYDRNAVAILYEDKVLGYVERRYSKVLHPKILLMHKEGHTATAEGIINVAKEMDNLHFLEINIELF